MKSSNSQFSPEELRNIDEADDLKIAPLRPDGITHGTPTWIWEVVVDSCLYVRAYHGTRSSWYQSAISQKAGQIHAAGLIWEVTFETVTGDINRLIDDAYRRKYSGSPYLSAMINEQAGAATVKIVPRES
ncbi:DUF2255 family protein [Sphingobacterium oryzagri]|uniref:DUF2255 family protein n=1 Tax=Sphingobacterium oryzagri TaxID=3025669 RepID=A0ABY7WQ64_9SPHI|nr:DUF2255 family protein [Sphingobacterium sp. KACC 22765]WDF70556.1 DUF2255 family protein [Sphingobacterium sp. KACC 22765]